MTSVAILGAGPLGAALAQRLAESGRCRSVVLIDANSSVAAGKALDLQQTTPIDNVAVSISASADNLAAASAAVIVIADRVDGGEWQGADGAALVDRLARAGTKSPFVFAGPSQVALMEQVHGSGRVPAERLLATAPAAIVSAVTSVASAALGRTGISLTVAGRPPALVVGWSSATASGMLLTQQLPPHRLLAISQALPRLWPPGPQTIAAATATVVLALAFGARRLIPAATILKGEWGAKDVAALLPLRLGHGRVLERVVPTLSPQEVTDVVNGFKLATGS